MQFVESMPYFVGNPLYHWSHLEMRRYFDIYDIINKEIITEGKTIKAG